MSDPITAENLSLELKVGAALLDGPLTLTELSERLGLRRQVVGRGLDVLFDQGQVKDSWGVRASDGAHVHLIELCEVAKPFFQAVRAKVERGD